MTTIHPDVADRYADLLLGSVLLQLSDHVGVFYRGEAERDAFVVPVLVSALSAECGVVYVCDRSSPDDVARQLGAAGVDVGAALRREQLHLHGGTDAYVGEGAASTRSARWTSTGRRPRRAPARATRCSSSSAR